jgi:hypothetical protein
MNACCECIWRTVIQISIMTLYFTKSFVFHSVPSSYLYSPSFSFFSPFSLIQRGSIRMDKKRIILGPDRHIPEAGHCPSCDNHLTGAFGIGNDSTPTEGDFCICSQCASPLIFQRDASFRHATVFDFAELDTDTREQIHMMMMTVQMMIDTRRNMKKMS